MGFPLLAGFTTKNWVKYDIPYEAKIIFATTTLLTSTVYARLIFERVSNFYKQYRRNISFSLSHISKYMSDILAFPSNYIFLFSVLCLVIFSLTKPELLTFSSVQSAMISTLLGGILFVSVIGIQADEFVKPITRTLDLVGAPFLVAALLLANLVYLKI